MSMLNEKRAEELLALTTKMIQAPSYSGQGEPGSGRHEEIPVTSTNLQISMWTDTATVSAI